MKKLLLAFCAAMLALVGFSEGESINLTSDVRDKYNAGQCSAPKVTAANYHATYSFVNAFDGVTTGSDSVRWLSASGAAVDTVWAQYVAPSDYEVGAKFALTSYKVYRLLDKGYDFARSPTKWEILGVLPSGGTEVVATQEWKWGSGDSDAVRIQTFQTVTANKYRGFRFHPLTTSSGDGVKFGLFEVEFFVTVSTEESSDLTIASSLSGVVGINPAVGENIVTNATCTAPTESTADGFPCRLLGYTLEKYEGGTWTGGATTNAGNSYVYSTANKGTYRLTWCYKVNYYNLVPTMRAEGFEPTFAGTQYAASTPPSNAFDGEKYDSSTSKRWLCELSKKPYVQASVGSAYHSKVYLMPVGYRLWRLNTANSGYGRSPKDWTFVGILSDGTEVTLDTVTDYTSWGSGNEESDRLRTFALSNVPDGDYRGFKFVPTKSQSDGYVGLLELEVLVQEVSAGGNSLTVTSSSAYDFECSPAVGTDLTEATTCTRTTKGYLGTSRYAKAGYKLYQLDGTEWKVIETNPTADTYTWDGTGGTLKLEWQWGAADGYTLDVTSYGQETFNYSVSPDARGFYDAGVVTITPVVQTDPVSTFKEWVGDVPAASKTTSPLVLTLDGAKTIRGEFTRSWKFVVNPSVATKGTFTDGNWSFLAEPDTDTAVGDYERDLRLPSGSYQEGDGLLDMTTLPSDTQRRITMVKGGAMNNGKTAITGLILPEGLAHLEVSSFNDCVNMTFVEMPNTVLKCDDTGSYGGGAFGKCTALTRVQLSNKMHYLGHQTFAGCTALTTVEPFLPHSITNVGSAFHDCTCLTGTLDLTGVKALENGSFKGCKALACDVDLTGIDLRNKTGTGIFAESGITSAKGVSALPKNIFYACPSITNIACKAGITYIYYQAARGCPLLRVVTAEDDFKLVTQIEADAFSHNTNLTLPGTWPSVTNLVGGVFYNTVFDPSVKLVFPVLEKNLERDTFRYAQVTSIDYRGSTFTTIPGDCFYRDDNAYVGELVIPESVTTLSSGCFANWNLSGKSYALRFCGAPPASIADNIVKFSTTYNSSCIYVPQEHVEAWKATTNSVGVADFVALKDIPDLEDKPGYAEISKKRLIGTWRELWCYTWVPNPKPCFTIIIR